MKDDVSVKLLAEALPLLQQAFRNSPATPCGPEHGEQPEDWPKAQFPAMAQVLEEVSTRMADNYPYFHPLYAGQMLKPPHPVAHAAYALAMWLNPNNHAFDGGRASSQMEIEAVREIAAMAGWHEFLGHLTGGGTMANLEALWVASQLAPGRRIAASAQAHYTHSRISAVLGLPFTQIDCDPRARMDMDALESQLAEGNIGTVVVTVGATATGAVDPLDQVLVLQQKYSFRIHVDAAYGGYFRLTSNLATDTANAFACLTMADSIVIDPHKHGLQPYGCGCVLFRDPSVGRFYRHNSPYTYFTSSKLHLGEISLECSRPGAAAVALWATQRLLPLVSGGEFARGLELGRAAALFLYEKLARDPRFSVPFAPELDILVWTVGARTRKESSRLARRVFDHAATIDLHLALADLPAQFFADTAWPAEDSIATVICLRSVLMKPEHYEWRHVIWEKLSVATDRALEEYLGRTEGKIGIPELNTD